MVIIPKKCWKLVNSLVTDTDSIHNSDFKLDINGTITGDKSVIATNSVQGGRDDKQCAGREG